MITVHGVDRSGKTHIINAADGSTLLEVLRDQGDFDIAAICGGSCACATCHVYVDAVWRGRMPEQSYDEESLLENLDNIQEGSRLSCQIRITEELDGLVVVLAPED